MIQTVPYPLYIGPLTIADKTAPHPDSLATGRESAVCRPGDASGEVLRAVPIGFLGGKARYGTLEVALVGPGALCLRWGRDGRGGICLEMQHFRTKFPSGIGLPGPSEAENRK